MAFVARLPSSASTANGCHCFDVGVRGPAFDPSGDFGAEGAWADETVQAWLIFGAEREWPILLGGRGRFIRDAKSEVFDVVHGLIEEHRDVVVVERVDDAASVAGSGDQSHCAQQT